jgi:hypothetical protein
MPGEGKESDEYKATAEETNEDENEVLMESLAHLEDLLFDSVSFGDDEDGDDEWNAPSSKTAESLRSELKELEDRALIFFEGGDGALARSGEYTLAQSEAYQRFASLVETRVEQFLAKRGSSARDLIAAMKRADDRKKQARSNGGSGGDWAADASREVASLLREVDDFELWATNMARRAADRERLGGK